LSTPLIRLFLLVLILLLMPTLNFLPVWFALSLLRFRRSEERFSRNAETDIVCRLLLEKKKGTRPCSSPGAGTGRRCGHRRRSCPGSRTAPSPPGTAGNSRR